MATVHGSMGEPAEGESKLVEREAERIRKEITCTVCGYLFTEPKTIPCLHTFCKQCIEASLPVTKSLTYCPVCRITFPCEILSVPIDHTINCIVEIVKQKDTGHFICNNCDQGMSAVLWCVECNNFLCGKCHDAHARLKACNSHKTVTVLEFLQNLYKYLPTEEAKPCKHHAKQLLDLYCKTCGVMICRDCTVKYHPRETHRLEFIGKIAEEKKEKLKDTMASLDEPLKQMRSEVTLIEEHVKQLDVKNEKSHKEIKAAYDEVYKLLKQQEEEALQKVETIYTSLKMTLALQKEKIKSLERQMETCHKFSNTLMMADGTQQLLTYDEWIFDRGSCLTRQAQHIHNNPVRNADDMIVTCAKPAKFVTPLCSVTPEVPLCTICSTIVKPNGIKLIAMLINLRGSPVMNQSSNLKVHCNTESECLNDVVVEEQSDGLYLMWYPLARVKNHVISIYCGGLVVKQAEIKVPATIRDYTSINSKELMIIDKYGPSNKPLKFPYLFAKGPNDEIIVNDDATNQLIVFDDELKFSHVIDGGQDTNGSKRLQGITGIAIDKRRYMYIADCKLNCIKKFKLDGQFVSEFGSEGVDKGQFRSPFGLLLTPSKLLYVCDRYNDRIQVFEKEQFSFCFGRYGKEPGNLHEPVDLTMNTNADKLFVTEFKNNRVQVFTLDGQFIQIFGVFPNTVELENPVGIFYAPDGHVLVSSYGTDGVLVFEADGTFVSAIEGTYGGRERFSSPCGVMTRDNGQVVIACNDGSHGNRLVLF